MRQFRLETSANEIHAFLGRLEAAVCSVICGLSFRPMARLTLSMVYAIINAMTVKIDKSGRIVLPKPVRERFHLREGSELELEERSDGLTLRPVEQRPSMVRKNGIWVHLGKVPRGFDWDTAVDAIREERIKDTSGA
jgi:AbrB family looped-hinge helix DNA binding protein